MGLRLPMVASQSRLELLQGLLLFAIAQKQAGQLLMAIGEIRFERDVFAIFLLGFLVILKVFIGEAKIEMQEREFRVAVSTFFNSSSARWSSLWFSMALAINKWN